jgi:iron complex outermembrane receptor protein
MLEEIIVTSQRREESLQEVPIAINAFTGAEMDVKGITSVAQY